MGGLRENQPALFTQLLTLIHCQLFVGNSKARVKVGELEQKVAIAEGQDSITLSVDLPSGPASLQTWIYEGDRKVRGAYYVQIEKRGE